MFSIFYLCENVHVKVTCVKESLCETVRVWNCLCVKMSLCETVRMWRCLCEIVRCEGRRCENVRSPNNHTSPLPWYRVASTVERNCGNEASKLWQLWQRPKYQEFTAISWTWLCETCLKLYCRAVFTIHRQFSTDVFSYHIFTFNLLRLPLVYASKAIGNESNLERGSTISDCDNFHIFKIVTILGK